MDAKFCSSSIYAMVKAAEHGQHPVEFCDNLRVQLTSWSMVDQYLTQYVTVGTLSGLEVKTLFEEQAAHDLQLLPENPERRKRLGYAAPEGHRSRGKRRRNIRKPDYTGLPQLVERRLPGWTSCRYMEWR